LRTLAALLRVNSDERATRRRSLAAEFVAHTSSVRCVVARGAFARRRRPSRSASSPSRCRSTSRGSACTIWFARRRVACFCTPQTHRQRDLVLSAAVDEARRRALTAAQRLSATLTAGATGVERIAEELAAPSVRVALADALPDTLLVVAVRLHLSVSLALTFVADDQLATSGARPRRRAASSDDVVDDDGKVNVDDDDADDDDADDDDDDDDDDSRCCSCDVAVQDSSSRMPLRLVDDVGASLGVDDVAVSLRDFGACFVR
jgi:hypothetical protein